MASWFEAVLVFRNPYSSKYHLTSFESFLLVMLQVQVPNDTST
jgi:hypothetical protein